MKVQQLKSLFFIAIISASFLSSSCRKQEVYPLPTNVENIERLVKFLSNTLEVDESKIQFDQTTEEFFVPNSIYREKLQNVQDRYSLSNVYKATFE